MGSALRCKAVRQWEVNRQANKGANAKTDEAMTNSPHWLLISFLCSSLHTPICTFASPCVPLFAPPFALLFASLFASVFSSSFAPSFASQFAILFASLLAAEFACLFASVFASVFASQFASLFVPPFVSLLLDVNMSCQYNNMRHVWEHLKRKQCFWIESMRRVYHIFSYMHIFLTKCWVQKQFIPNYVKRFEVTFLAHSQIF